MKTRKKLIKLIFRSNLQALKRGLKYSEAKLLIQRYDKYGKDTEFSKFILYKTIA